MIGSNNLTLPGCKDNYLRLYPQLLDDENVIDKLDQASKMGDKKGIETCLIHILAFPSKSINKSLDRYFHFYEMMEGERTEIFRKDLHDAFFPILKSQSNIQEVLESCLTQKYSSAGYFSKILIELFFHKEDRTLCLLMIDIINKFKISCDYETTSRYLPLLAELSRTENSQLILTCLVMFYRETKSGIKEEINHFKSKSESESEYPQLLTDLLHAAFITKHLPLLFDCLEELFSHVYSYIYFTPQKSDIFSKICQIKIEELLAVWVASLLVEETSFQRTQHLLSFLCHYPHGKTPENFYKLIETATCNFSHVQKRDLICRLIKIATTYQEEQAPTLVFGLIDYFSLYEDSDFRKSLISLLINVWKQNPPRLGSFISFINKIPAISNEIPLYTLLKEFLNDLPAEKYLEVFELLNLGMTCIRHPLFSDLCLIAIDKYKIHHMIPEWLNCSKLLQKLEGQEIIPYFNTVIITVNGPEGNQPVKYAIPRGILEGRAPLFMQTLQNSSFSLEDLEYMLNFIVRPHPVENVSIKTLANLYQFADAIDERQFKRMAQDYILKQPIQWENKDALLKIYKISFGEFRNELTDDLLALACSQSITDFELAKKIVDEMYKSNPEIFMEIKLYSILMRIQFPNKRFLRTTYVRERPTVTKSFVDNLKKLMPEIKHLDLDNCFIEEGVLREIGKQYPDLLSLKIDFKITGAREYHHDEISTLKIKSLKFIGANGDIFQLCSKLELEALEFYDLYFSDKQIKKWLEGIYPPNELFKTLKILKFKRNKSDIKEPLTDEGLSLLLPHLSKLEVLDLEACRVTDTTLQLIQNNIPQLKGFSAILAFYDFKNFPLLNLNEFLKKYPSLNDLSLWLISLKPSDNQFSLDGISSLHSLHSLAIHVYENEELIIKAISGNFGLEKLNLQSSQVTTKSIPIIADLKNLQTLNLANTGLSRNQIINLAEQLPNLRMLTIQFSNTIEGREDERKIVEILALRNIDVNVIKNEI